MRLATLKDESLRDGRLILINRDHSLFAIPTGVPLSLREAIEDWSVVRPKLEEIQRSVDAGTATGLQELKWNLLHSPLPRSFQWVDGSAFIHHVKLVRKARGAELPENLLSTPLMYQGGSDSFLTPLEPIPQVDFAHGTDFEGEVAVIVDDVPMGIGPKEALEKIILIMLCNDVSLRGLIPGELALGFGFFQSKPSSAFSPIALTLDEVSPHWRGGRLHLPLQVRFNGKVFGRANAGEMHFDFGQLIAHAAKTRPLIAGTIVGSGTVSNPDPSVGSSCLAEKRMIEQIETGSIQTPFMKVKDRVEIEMLDPSGRSLFGRIDQTVVSFPDKHP